MVHGLVFVVEELQTTNTKPIYSVRKLFTGFANAALNARYPTVSQAMIMDEIMVNTKMPALNGMENAYCWSHLCMK